MDFVTIWNNQIYMLVLVKPILRGYLDNLQGTWNVYYNRASKASPSHMGLIGILVLYIYIYYIPYFLE